MTPQLRRRHWLQAAAALALPTTPQAWAATPFPNRPVKLIVPMQAGGTADVAARLLANAMEAPLGQPVVVDNRPGGAFMVALNAVKSAPADGYTLLNINAAFLATQAVYGQYDIFKQLVPLIGSGETDICFAVSGKTPYRSMKELIDYGRANPGRLTYASPGAGSLEHLALANLCQRYGIEAVHVPVKGGPDMLKMLMQGEADFSTLAVPLVQAYAVQGRVRGLVVLSEKRNAAVPEIPTYVEEKLDVPRLTIWGGLAAVAGTPQATLDALEKAAAVATQQPEMQQKLVAAGMTPMSIPSAVFGKIWRDDYAWIARVAAVVKPTLSK